MAQTLEEIAKKLKESPKKVQLIYAFNGTGKTRLSREFTKLISPLIEGEEAELTRNKILYYNAFTEDLFSWDNDLENDIEPKLKIQNNTFIDWILADEGKEQVVEDTFHHYSNDRLKTKFSTDYSEVTFSFQRGNEEPEENIKISKGEESNFIWSIFNTLIEEVISVVNTFPVTNRTTDKFNDLEYIFIDDPVSSLDENHLIQLAVNLAQLIRENDFEKNKLKFIISTHNPLFYNVLYGELKQKYGFLLSKNNNDTFEINAEKGESNKHFSYHLHLIKLIKDAIKSNNIEKFHFMLLRNLYEKTAGFLGYMDWSDLLPIEARESYEKHIHHFSHKKLSNEEVRMPNEQEKQIVNFLLNHLIDEYSFWKEGESNNAGN